MSKIDIETSKFLSYILRHAPESINLSLSHEGWANLDELIKLSNECNHPITLDKIQEIVKHDSKQRFSISDNGHFIRANQGHSLKNLNLNYDEMTPPNTLFHGTANRFIDDIKHQGLIPMSRQFVHLTENKDTALQVGKRYGKPVLLIIDSKQMLQDGFKFYHTQNNIWLTKSIPTGYIKLI